MPYIPRDDRARARLEPATPGELNYAITIRMITVLEIAPKDLYEEFYATVLVLVEDYIERVGMSYTNGNAVMGVLDCAGREMMRRIPVGNMMREACKIDLCYQLERLRQYVYIHLLTPYEEKKIAENGDVYTSVGPRGDA